MAIDGGLMWLGPLPRSEYGLYQVVLEFRSVETKPPPIRYGAPRIQGRLGRPCGEFDPGPRSYQTSPFVPGGVTAQRFAPAWPEPRH